MVIRDSLLNRIQAQEAQATDRLGLLEFIRAEKGAFDRSLYCRLLGAANEFKEGDQIIGIAAANAQERQFARQLLANTLIQDVVEHSPYSDQLFGLTAGSARPQANQDAETSKPLGQWTFGELKAFLLDSSEAQIKQLMPQLSSDVIGCVVKLMSNSELISVGAKVFNPLPGSKIGAKG